MAGVVAVAAFTRLFRLDLMEFKADEAEACRLALHVLGYGEPGVGRFFPTQGLASSVGVPNAPLFIYLVALPLAVVRSPIAVAVAIAASNIVAVWLSYRFGKKCFSTFVGCATAALFALSPWGIVFSRKIWAQDILPIFSIVFLLQLHALLVERRPRAVAWLIIIAAAATQLHFSAIVLVVILIAALVVAREVVRPRWLAVGVLGAAAIYAPFVALHARGLAHSLGHSRSGNIPLPHRFTVAAHFTVAISGGDWLRYLLGSQPPFLLPLSLLLAGAALVGLVHAWLRSGDSATRTLRLLLVIWFILPTALLTLLPFSDAIHYFIVLFPLPFLGIALTIDVIRTRWSSAGLVILGAVLCAYAAIDVSAYRIVARNDGAPGAYGVAYRAKADAIDVIVRKHPNQNVEVAADLDFNNLSSGSEYRLLLWNAAPSRKFSDTRSDPRFVIAERDKPLPPLLAADPAEPELPQTRVGPLVVFSLPVHLSVAGR